MSFNISFQPNAAALGEYAYAAHAVKQARDNIDQSITRGMQAAEFNANNARQWAQLQIGQDEFNAGRYDRNRQNDIANQQFELTRLDKLNEAGADAARLAQKDYAESRDGFDKILAAGTKDGWLRLEPEQRQKLRQLNSADAQISMRDDLDDQTKIKMMQLIHNQRRDIIPTIVPEYDRPLGIHEEVSKNMVVMGRNGVRPLAPGEKIRPDEKMYFVGKRDGSPHLTAVDIGDEEQKQSSAGASNDWSRMSVGQKYSHAEKHLQDRWGTVSKMMLDIYKEDAKNIVNINKVPVFGYEVSDNGGDRVIRRRMFDLSKPEDKAAYLSSAIQIGEPGFAYDEAAVMDEVSRRDQAVGIQPGQSQQPSRNAMGSGMIDAGDASPDEIDSDDERFPPGRQYIVIDPSTGKRAVVFKSEK